MIMIMIMIIIKNNKQTGRVQRQKILNVELASLSDSTIKTIFMIYKIITVFVLSILTEAKAVDYLGTLSQDPRLCR